MARKRHRLLRIVAWSVGPALAFVVVAAVTIKFFIAPHVIRTRINSSLSERWDGRAEIKSIGFNWGGSVRVDGIDLYDTAGLRWVHVDSVELGFRDLIGAAPVLERVAAMGLAVRWPYGANVRLPIKQAPPSDTDYSKYIDLSDVRLETTAFELVDEHGKRQAWGGLEFRGVPASGGLSVTVREIGHSKSATQGAEALVIDGLIDTRTYNCRLKLTLNHRFTSDEGAAILAAAGLVDVYASGGVAADLTIDGPVIDPRALQVKGQVDMTDWEARDAKGPLAEAVGARAKFSAGYRVDVEVPGAGVLTGTASGSFFFIRPPREPLLYGGDLAVQRIDMARLHEVMGGRSWPDKGLLTAKSDFSGRSDSYDSFRARATGVVEDADLMNMPVLPELVKMMGISDVQGLKSSELAAALHMAGATITIERANVANAVSALEAQKGGTINIQTTQLDLHVVGVPLKHLTPLLNLPVISLFSNLEKKLTRLHVKGPWTDPTESLIRPEPLANVGAGTLEFFQSAAKGGGKLGSDFLKLFER